MAEQYSALASVYQAAGLGASVEMLRQRLFDKVQMEGWLGRRVLDLGCGTGTSACWFAANGFRVTGLDRSAEMLAQARQTAEQQGVVVDWREADICETTIDDGYDLVLALGVLNELRSTRELEAALRLVYQALSPEKLFVFDLQTIQGMAENWGGVTRVLYDDPAALMVLASGTYSYETTIATLNYTVFQRLAGTNWQRSDETHQLRAFQLQSVGAVLQRVGFRVQQVVNGALQPFDPASDRTGRAVLITSKSS